MESSLLRFADLALQALAPVVLALGTWLAHRLIKAFEAKTHVDVPVKQEAQVDAWITEGVRLAEEKAHQAAQASLAKITGPEKLEAAVSFALDMAEKNGWISWTRDRLKAKVEAQVNILKDRPGLPAGQ